MLTITGATASGKTRLAALLADKIKGEIISADSRQVYRGMDIGTGKDLEDYIVNGKEIPVYLINILDAGEKYNVYRFQNDFLTVYNQIRSDNKIPILCGGSGLYIEAVLKAYKLIQVPINHGFRESAKEMKDEQLKDIIFKYDRAHNSTDFTERKRLVRAAEIALFYARKPELKNKFPKIESVNFQVVFDRLSRRRRITERLRERLNSGMIEEVEQLLKNGVAAETMIYYGLEYKYVTLFLKKEITYKEMAESLEIAIHQFSKRQMTWFRKMQKKGIKLHQIPGDLPMDEKVNRVLKIYKTENNS